MLRLEMLPAEHGDALLLEYGPGEEPTHRTLIDAGPEVSYATVRQRLATVPAAADGVRDFELLIVTHVDGDHIEGVVKLLQDEELACRFGDVWFNDWNHLAPLERRRTPPSLGPEAGEFLGALLDEREQPWNRAFEGGVIMVPQDEDEPLPTWTTPGGLRLTVLSPTIDTLLALRKTWKKAIEAAGFRPGDRTSALRQFAQRRWARPPSLGDERVRRTLDHSAANGSSIAVLAKYGGRRLLLSGDAFAPVLRTVIERSAGAANGEEHLPMALDAFKLPHHGSDKNMTPQLLEVIACPTYLVSTSGKRFRHPDRGALKLIVERHSEDEVPRFHFNYETRITQPWGRRDDCAACYGDAAVLELETDP